MSHKVLLTCFAWNLHVAHVYRLLALQMVSHMLLNASIAAACCAVAAFMVLPSLAGDQVYSNVAAALRHTGHSLSGYSPCMCLLATSALSSRACRA